MMKSVQVCGMGSALLDILCRVEEPLFQQLALDRGTMKLVSLEQQQQLLSVVSADGRPHYCAGGSVANSMAAFAQMGGKASFICILGEDRYGTFYQENCDELGIVTNGAARNGPTGTCLALITPDSERTLRTHLGVSQLLSAREIPPAFVKKSEWLFIEGYVLACPAGPSAITRAVELAGAHHTKVALTLGDTHTAKKWADEFPQIFERVDMLFGNESEAQALTGAPDIDASLKALKQMVRGAAITAGPEGAWAFALGQETKVPAFPCVPVDTTVAGDMFAGAFLHTLRQTQSVEQAAQMGCFMASKVISQFGARLPNENFPRCKD